MYNMGRRVWASINKYLEQFISFCGGSDSSAEKEEKAIAAIKKEPIPVDQFLQKFKQKKLDKYLNFEVRAIVRNQDEYSCSVAMMPDNVLKNVNQDVVPYDSSRVVLTDLPPDDADDYINASYIQGCNGEEKAYIATQGPKGKNVAAFWHLVWQEGVHCIVMATGLFENAVQQCDKYWGDVLSSQKYVRHGDVHIRLKDDLELSKLVIRTFIIKREGSDEERTVKHFEMSGFNDENADPGFVLDVHRRVANHMLISSGPVLVHCRCGGGKTAVFIGVDYCLKQLENDNFVDIYAMVLHLRKFRKNMVRTLAQYKLIYDTVALHVQCEETVVPSAQLPARVQKLCLKDRQSRVTGFERQLQCLSNVVPKILNGDCASGHRDENRNKSRDIMLLPPERARPYLQTMESTPGDTGTDFINAVFVDGYHQPGSFIVTQWPMHSTVNDIWRMLYDFKIHSLVLLNDSKSSRGYPCFWPRDLDKEEKYGPIGVKYIGCQKYSHIVIRAFIIRKPPNTQYNSMFDQLGESTLNDQNDKEEEEKMTCLPMVDLIPSDNVIVKIFHYTYWNREKKTPNYMESFLYMMGCVDEWQQNTAPLNPICVMSKDGYSKCGIYCALSICCDQLHCEKEIDIFHAARIVKKNRPQLIPTLAEYEFCYKFMVLVVKLMQEDKPKIVITSPEVIEGEVRQGFETVTGFQNILSCNLDRAPSESGTFQTADSDSDISDSSLYHSPPEIPNSQRSSKSSAGSGKVDTNLHTVVHIPESHCDNEKNNNIRSIPNKKLSLNLVGNGHQHLPCNNASIDISPPASPGQIWTPEKEIQDKLNQAREKPPGVRTPLLSRQSIKRRPLLRQDAEEHVELRDTEEMDYQLLKNTTQEVSHV